MYAPGQKDDVTPVRRRSEERRDAGQKAETRGGTKNTRCPKRLLPRTPGEVLPVENEQRAREDPAMDQSTFECVRPRRKLVPCTLGKGKKKIVLLVQ